MQQVDMTSFFGRDSDMQELSTQVLQHRCVVLCGPDGIGKTTLVRAFAQRQQDRNVWADGVTWVSLRNIGSTVDARIRIVFALHLEPASAESNQALVRTLGSDQTLLLLDEVDQLLQKDRGAAVELLRALLGLPQLHLVITCRDAIRGFTSMLLQPLAEKDAKDVFLAHAPSKFEQGKIWRSLLRVLDGHPYMIRLAASYFEQTQGDLESLLQSLQPGKEPSPAGGRVGELFKQMRESFASTPTPAEAEQNRQRKLAAMLDLSFAALSPAAQDACGLLSLFPAGLTDQAVNFLLDEAAEQALPTLVRFGLAEHEADYDYERFVLTGAARARVQGYPQTKAWNLVGPRALQFFHVLTHKVHHQIVGGEEIAGGLLASLEQPNLDQVLDWGYLHEQPAEPKSLSARATSLLHNYWKLTMTLTSVPLAQLEAALAAAQKVADFAGVARIQHIMGDIHHMRGTPELGLRSYQQALASFAQSNVPDDAVVVHYDLGFFLAKGGNHAAALASFEQALAMYQAEGDQAGVAMTYASMIRSQKALGDKPALLATLEQVARLSVDQDEPDYEARVNHILGDMCRKQGYLAEALAKYEQARAAYMEQDDPQLAGFMLREMGDVHFDTGAHDTALDHYTQALKLFEPFDNHIAKAQMHYRIGEFHKAQQNYDAALTSYEQSLHYFQAVSEEELQALSEEETEGETFGRSGQALIHASLGEIYHKTNNLKLAVRNYALAVELYHQERDMRAEVHARIALADILQELGDHETAQDIYQNAIPLLEYLKSQEER